MITFYINKIRHPALYLKVSASLVAKSTRLHRLSPLDSPSRRVTLHPDGRSRVYIASGTRKILHLSTDIANMPAKASLVVCKPQVMFSERFTDPHLHRLTITQLRKKARENKLDVSLLSQKWEFIHVLVQLRTQGAQAQLQHVTDPKRRTIFDLPGEIRNTIYSYVLSDSAIWAQYNTVHLKTWRPRVRSDSVNYFSHELGLQMFAGGGNLFYDTPASPAVPQLRNMSWANRRLREEVRGFFFANNRFLVSGNEPTCHGNFLKDIGADGRANIATLDLSGAYFWRYNHSFESMIVTCASLRNLAIRMPAGHVLTDSSYDSLRSFADSLPQQDPKALEEVDIKIGSRIALFSRLPALSDLKLKCVVPEWYIRNAMLFSYDGVVVNAMHMAIKTALLKALGECLKGKGVDMTVDIVTGAPELSNHMQNQGRFEVGLDE